MQIHCPHCRYHKEMSDAAVPPLPCTVTCPQCGQRFTLEAEQVSAPPVNESVTPPPLPVEPVESIEPPDIAPAASAGGAAPAGFWLRVIASLLDSLLCNALVFAMAFSLGMVLQTNAVALNEPMQLVMALMGIVVSVFYYVFFTGYCGQTPGKMALRIKVIDNDDGNIGYGQAFVRETIGKTISGMLFGIGYLMVGLRRDKRGLHDLLSRTKVIKL